MGAVRIVYQPESKCGYVFERKKGGKRYALTPEPYSKVTSSGEVVILIEEERKAWLEAYHQAVKELDKVWCDESEEVYYKVEEILKKTGNYRFL